MSLRYLLTENITSVEYYVICRKERLEVRKRKRQGTNMSKKTAETSAGQVKYMGQWFRGWAAKSDTDKDTVIAEKAKDEKWDAKTAKAMKDWANGQYTTVKQSKVGSGKSKGITAADFLNASFWSRVVVDKDNAAQIKSAIDSGLKEKEEAAAARVREQAEETLKGLLAVMSKKEIEAILNAAKK